jgi:hypothetical protein
MIFVFSGNEAEISFNPISCMERFGNGKKQVKINYED